MKKLSFLILSVFAVVSVMAQGGKTSVSGKIVDASGEPLIGVSVIVPGSASSIGTATDLDGTFTLSVPANTDEIEVSYIGYKTMTVAVSKGKDTRLGNVVMEMDSQMLEDVVVTQSVAVQRKTPVAVSSVDLNYIEEKLGGQEFPEILKSTPGVYATKQGGGYGDSKINMRGFKSENIAVMINGVPVNDMEWGGVYWSNWAGLADVTRSMQTQRGLGASKISSPSVGGTINIVTRSLDAKAGGSISYSIGNDLNQAVSFNVSTGVTKNGWAITVLGAHRWGDGYIQGTDYEGWNYFANISKRINDKHQLSLTAFGAPQKHYQRSNYDGLTIAGWQEVKKYMGDKSPYKYNPTFGYDKNGQRRSSAVNQYHKPQISLNHQWQINENQSLSTAVYASIASGYGYSAQSTSAYSSGWYGANNGVLNMQFRKDDGTFDYGAVQELNANSKTGAQMVMAKGINSHQWYGLLSTYTNHLNDWLELSAGLDLRYYIGEHSRVINDLYDGAYFIDRYRANVAANNNAARLSDEWVNKKLGVGDVVNRDYDGHVMQEGVFAQLEYSKNRLSAFVSGSLSNTSYWRVDRYYYDADHAKSGVVSYIGGTIKGGVNYNIDRYNNVFANVGYISRAPYFSGGAFLSAYSSHMSNPDAKNEKIISAEVGYGFHNSWLALNLNAYYTLWKDKTMTNSGPDYTYTDEVTGMQVTERSRMNLQGVDARHMGIELDFKATATDWLDINGMFSWGDWIWNSNAEAYWYSEGGTPLTASGEKASFVGVTEWNENLGIPESEFKAHAKTIIDIKGVKVAGSAQTTAMLGLTFKPMKGLRVGVDWNVYARNYADFDINSPTVGVNTYPQTWEIPWGNQFDFSANYSFNITKRVRATVYGNINNVFNQQYIVDAYDGATHNWDSAYRVFYAFGRTFTVRLKVAF